MVVVGLAAARLKSRPEPSTSTSTATSARVAPVIAPETFVTVLEEAESCDAFSEGIPTDNPGANGCVGSQPPLEPYIPFCINDQDGPSPHGPTTGGPAGPSAPAPSGPSTGGPNRPGVTTGGGGLSGGRSGGGSRTGPTTGGPKGPSAPSPRGPTTGGPSGPSTGGRGGKGREIDWPRRGGGSGLLHELPRKPSTTNPSGSASTGAPLWEFQPNRATQGLEILEQSQHGSVSLGTQRLQWAEIDVVAPGVTPESGFVFGRRYFSGLEHDGRGSTGARWISSITERLVLHESEVHGLPAVQHLSWEQPYNDPDYYYLPAVAGDDVFHAPAFIGGTIARDGDTYQLTFKNGAVHTFADFGDDDIRIVQRTDPWGNTTDFTYDALDMPISTILITDARGVVWTVLLDTQGYITSLTNALGQTWDFQYVTAGPNSYLTKVLYPSRDVMEPNDTIVNRRPEREYAYTAHGRLEYVYDDYGAAIMTNVYRSDDPSRISTQTDATGAVYTFTTPSTTQTDVMMPRGWKKSYLLNSMRQVVELRQYIANFNGDPARTTNTALYHGWLFERGNSCNCGPITKITEPDGGTIHVLRDSAFNISEVWKRSADQTAILKWKWTYDSSHRIATFVPPEGNAAVNPAPYTVTYTRSLSGTNLVTTKTVPARDWRTAPSVWVTVSDSSGRVLERTGPSHDYGTPSFLGKYTYHTSGSALRLPMQSYQRDASTVAYTFGWNAVGHLTSFADAAGNQWTCAYDPEGRPVNWQAPAINGSQVYAHEWLYDGNGRVRRMRWKYYADDVATTGPWVTWSYQYDAMGQVLTRSRQMDNASPTPTFATEQWAYDLHGNVTTALDPDGQTSTILYDERDLPWLLTDGAATADAAVRAYDYNPDGRLSQVLQQMDATRITQHLVEYDKLDRQSRWRVRDLFSAAEAGYVESYYDSGSRLQEIRTYALTPSAVAQLIDKKTFVYDDYHSSPTQQTNHVYDLATGTMLRAVQTDFNYGPSGRLLSTYQGTDLVTKNFYYPNGLPHFVEDGDGNSVAFTYDQYRHSLTEINTFRDAVTGTTFSTTRTFGRDKFGRVLTITDSGTSVPTQVHTYVHDSLDNVVCHVGPDGATQWNQYRFDGLQTREDASIQGSTVRARLTHYTPAGRRQSFVDDRGVNVNFLYDGRGRLRQESYLDGTTWTHLLNHAGLLTKLTAPSGKTIDFAYDWRGMISGAVYKDHLGVVQRTDTLEIDLGGFIKKVTKTESGVTQSVEMLHDSSGRVLSETTAHPTLPTTKVVYSHDALGQLISIDSPCGYRHDYEYDTHYRVALIGLKSDSEYTAVAAYDYTGAGQSVRRRTTGDGSTMSVLRDGHGRISQIQTPGVADFVYGYDAGNRVNRELRVHDALGDAHWYDGIGRLTATTRDSVDPVAELASGGTGSTARAYRRSFALDGDSHRTQVVTTPMTGSAVTTDYVTHGVRHHYTSTQVVGQPAVSRVADSNGRVTSIGNRVFTYDFVDNLVQVTDAGVTTATYTYDALGRRLTKIAGGFEYRYVHAGPWMIEDHRRTAGSGASWSLKGAYVHGPGVDNLVMTRHVDWIDQDGDGDTAEAKNLYFHTNRLDSVSELTAESGTVVETYRYEEFGKPTIRNKHGSVVAASESGNPFLFTGREYDAETGYYHYRARTYDPATGTFLQEDPLGMHDGLNVVAYVHANPVNLTDPFGTTGVGELMDSVMAFVNKYAGQIADILLDLFSPLEGLADLISAATGYDWTGWLRGGCPKDGPAAMGWWDRACAAVSGVIDIAAGAVTLIPALRKILDLIDWFSNTAMSAGLDVAKRLFKGTACFVAGTLVVMSDGSLVPIEAVEAGQEVAAETPGATPSLPGVESSERVAGTTIRAFTGAIIALEVRDGSRSATVKGTPEHPFWCVNRHQWVPMGELLVGDVLDGLMGPVVIGGRGVTFEECLVYNFEVARSHTYRVSELGVLVHNRYTPDQKALLDMAKASKHTGISNADADVMLQLADQANANAKRKLKVQDHRFSSGNNNDHHFDHEGTNGHIHIHGYHVPVNN